MRTGVILVLILGVGLAVGLLVRAGDAEEATPTTGATTTDPGMTEDRLRKARPAENSEAAVRNLTEPLARQDPAVLTWTVEVVDGVSGRPVSGAEVWRAGLQEIRDNAPQETPLASWLLDGGLRQLGRRALADDRGRAELPKTEGMQVVAAFAGGRAGIGTLWGGEEGTVTLRIHEPVHLRVAVIDRNGNPVGGVPVAVHGAADRSGAIGRSFVSRDEDGIAVFTHFECLLGGLPADTPLTIAPLIPLADDVQAVVDRDALAAGELFRIVLPPLGGLVLTRPESLPRVFLQEATITIASLGSPDLPPEVRARRRFNAGPGVDAGFVAGRATFERVGLGLDLSLDVHLPRGGSANARVAGPREAGETLTLDLAEALDVAFAVVKVRDEEGAPVRDASAVVSFCGDGPSWLQTARTTGDGRLLLVVTGGVNGETATRAELEVRVAAGEPPMRGSAALRGLARGSCTDLGEVRVEEPDLLATGAVVDRRDQGVEHFGLRVRLQRASTPFPGQTLWHDLEGTTAKISGRGAFEIWGETDASRLRVVASCPHYFGATSVSFPPGTRGVRITLRRGVSLGGSIRQDAGAALDVLRILLRAPDGSEPRGWGATVAGSDGRFEIRGVAPGTYDLRVVLPYVEEPLLVIEDVVVRDPGGTTDPRLEGIDLRGRIRLTTLTLVDDAGRPAPGVYLTYGDPGSSMTRATDPSGRLCLVTPRSGLDVCVRDPAWRPVDLSGVSEDREIVVRRPIQVHVGAKAAPELPAGWSLAVQLEPSDSPAVAGPHAADAPTASFAEGEARLALLRTGSHRVRWFLLESTGETSWTCHPVPAPAEEVIVTEGSSPQRITLAAPAAAIEEALETLGLR